MHFTIKAHAPNGSPARRRYMAAMLVSVAGFPIAFGCVLLGSYWHDGPHFRLRVHNDTKTDIDEVTVHFKGGDVAVGPIRAGTFDETGLLWHGHGIPGGPLYITTRVGGKSLKKEDRVNCNDYHLKRSPYDIHIEDHELPKR